MGPKENIINCAFDVLSRKGYDQASVREIASAASVNVAMINYYFGSKSGLFDAVIQSHFKPTANLFAEIAGDKEQPAIDRIERVLDYVIERKFSNRHFHYMLHNELALKNHPELKDKIAQYIMVNISLVKKIIKQGIQSGEFRKVDVELTVATIIGSIHYLLISDTLCQKILGKDSSFTPFNNKALKKRVSRHVKALAESFLLKK